MTVACIACFKLSKVLRTKCWFQAAVDGWAEAAAVSAIASGSQRSTVSAISHRMAGCAASVWNRRPRRPPLDFGEGLIAEPK
jgi:hypothetical protein